MLPMSALAPVTPVSLETLIACLQELTKSAERHTRHGGRQGYLQFIDGFLNMMRGETPFGGKEMGDLKALEGVLKFPVRVKCATTFDSCTSSTSLRTPPRAIRF